MQLSQEQIDIEIQIGIKQQRIEELESWFNNFFQPQLIQSMWQTNFRISKDIYLVDENLQPLEYESIEGLKAKGEDVRAQIKSLRDEIKYLNLQAEQLAMLNQNESDTKEFAEYNEFVEGCKKIVKQSL